MWWQITLVYIGEGTSTSTDKLTLEYLSLIVMTVHFDCSCWETHACQGETAIWEFTAEAMATKRESLWLFKNCSLTFFFWCMRFAVVMVIINEQENAVLLSKCINISPISQQAFREFLVSPAFISNLNVHKGVRLSHVKCIISVQFLSDRVSRDLKRRFPRLVTPPVPSHIKACHELRCHSPGNVSHKDKQHWIILVLWLASVMPGQHITYSNIS